MPCTPPQTTKYPKVNLCLPWLLSPCGWLSLKQSVSGTHRHHFRKLLSDHYFYYHTVFHICVALVNTYRAVSMRFLHIVFVGKRVRDCKTTSLACVAAGLLSPCSQDCEPPRATCHWDSTLHICHCLFILTAFIKANRKQGNEVSLLCSHLLQVSQEVVGSDISSLL